MGAMEEKFEIIGGRKLSGKIKISGAKNAAGPVLAATILTDEDCYIGNLPKVSDVVSLISILEDLGKKIEWVEENKIKVSGKEINPDNLKKNKIAKARISVLLMGAMFSRFKKFKFSSPGGDRIGVRPIDAHLMAFQQLGATVERDNDFYYLQRDKLTGKEIVLPEFSVTATENIMLASAMAQGKTIIKIAAQEPHIQDLAQVLNKMGGNVKTFWPNTLEITGVEKLGGFSHNIIPDTNEVGTFAIIGALAGEEIIIENIETSHLDLFFKKMSDIGCVFEKGRDYIKIWRSDKLRATRIQALPYPGFPTDLLPLIVPLLTQAEGKSLIHDPLYENRLSYIQELKKMGADIEIVDPHRAFVFGKTPLNGLSIESWDIRAGASLVAAGLIANGKTTIKNIRQIDRGYEKFDDKLRALGAEIKRVYEEE